MRYRAVKTLAGKGAGRDQFRTALTGLAIGPDGDLYAVGDRQVKAFDTDSGRLRRQWPTARPGRCVAVDRDGRVLVGQAGQIEIFDERGQRLDLWSDKEKLGLVTTIAFFEAELFIGDAQHRCIRRFTSDRRHRNDIGTGTNTRGFAIPNGHLDFCVDGQGTIVAAHSGKHRVERYAPDGRLLGRFGHFGMRDPADFRGCCNPTNIALTPDGKIVVTEKAGPRTKVYDAEGTLLAVMGEEYFHANCRNMDVAVDEAGRIYVADTVRLHVQVFALEAGQATLESEPVFSERVAER